jgi:formylglycine-generating enzyme required for sulfatase activity
LLVTALLVPIARLSIDPDSLAAPSREMVLIPAGEFSMGSLSGHLDERPPHQVYVKAFYMDKYEVTNLQYLQFFRWAMGQCKDHVWLGTKADNRDGHIVYTDGRYIVEAGYERHPVTLVSWHGAQAYCQHQGKRLPTEA